MVPGGYERICNLKVGDRVAVESLWGERVWSAVKSVTPIGKLRCYDICITDGKDPNFIVEGFIVHNTWIMLKSAADDYQLYNQRVVIWSREMNRERMAVRIACILAKVDYQLFKNGALPKHLERLAMAYLDQLALTQFTEVSELKAIEAKSARMGGADILMLCGRDAPRTLEELTQHVRDFGADIVYLDSFYHLQSANSMESKQRWSRVASLAEDIKSSAENEMIPHVGIGQANRSGEKSNGETMTDVADADAIGREADLVLRVIKKRGRTLHEDGYEVLNDEQKAEEYAQIEPPPPVIVQPRGRPLLVRYNPDAVQEVLEERPLPDKAEEAANGEPPARFCAEIAIALPGNREGVLEGFMIRAVPGYDFGVIKANYTADEVQKWQADDDKAVSIPAPTGVKADVKNLTKGWEKPGGQGNKS
jgi:hypothetical protein